MEFNDLDAVIVDCFFLGFFSYSNEYSILIQTG